MQIDLHLHTHYSDGTFTPQEVVERAQKVGLSAISVTDHDTIEGLPEVFEAASDTDVEVLSGTELTASFKDRELHVLGYGFDPQDITFSAQLKAKQHEREGRMLAMVEKVQALGFDIAYAEVEAAAEGSASIGRPHLAEVMVRKGIVGDLTQAFHKYIGDQGPCFVKKATWTVEEACRAIQTAGGVAVLAHPYGMVEDAWMSELAQAGIQGIEALYPEHSRSAQKGYMAIAERFNWVVTGGSDCHGQRKVGGPRIGTFDVPQTCLDQLKALLN